MSNDSSKHCTLIDKFGAISDKNKDHKHVFELLSKLCMLSLLTKRVTFLIPVGKALKEISKLTAAQQRDQFKRHIIGGAFEKSELEGKERVYTKMVIDKSKRIAYAVAGKGASLTIGGVKVGKLVIKIEGSTRDGKKIPVGTAYELSELLPIPGEEVPLKPRYVKKGGGYTFANIVDREVDYITSLQGQELRWEIVEQYRKSWPLSVFGIDSEYSWHQWALASLVSFLKERIPDFYHVYSPYLGMDSFASLDLLFEYYVKSNYHKYILPDDLISEWVRSNWYMHSDPVILRNNFNFLAGGGMQSGGDGLNNIITLNANLANRYVVAGKQAIGEFLQFRNPEKVREGIVKVYKKVYSEPNVLLGETRSIYKKVDEQPYIVALQNDLRRFMGSRFRNHSEFDMLYPTFLQSADCDQKSFWGFFGGSKSKSGPKWFLKTIMQYDTESLKVNLDGSDKFRFPMRFWKDFVDSPFYLYMSIIDKPERKYRNIKVSDYVQSFPSQQVRAPIVSVEYAGVEHNGVKRPMFDESNAFTGQYGMNRDPAQRRHEYSGQAVSLANLINSGN